MNPPAFNTKAIKTAVIIGGGIAGCSTAYALAKRGFSVKLIERHTHLAQEASGNPVAMLYPKFNTGTSVLSHIAADGFRYTLSLLKQLPSHHNIADMCGLIQLAYNQSEQEKQATLFNHSPQNMQLLNASEASEKANLKLDIGGLYLPEAGWVKPAALCDALTQSEQIDILTTTQAISINKVADRWHVNTQQQVLDAEIVIICNANDVQAFSQCNHIPITAVRGQVNFFAKNDTSNAIQSVICTDHYLSPAVDGFHSIGTSYAPNDTNPRLSSQDTKANLAALKVISTKLYSSINPAQLTGRVAWRSATKDYLPLAGALIDEQAIRKNPPRYNDAPNTLPWLKGLYINAGHGSKGMITAPICGELIANLACNEPLTVDSAIASNLNPNRFLLKDLGLKKMAQNLYGF